MNKQKKSFISKFSKPGVASLYIVIFATILFGVVTLSFTRVILSEASQSSDDDLSRSAYDSAMAGVEDAKRAVNEYYRCLGSSSSSDRCNSAARTKLFQADCNPASGGGSIGIADYLGLAYHANPETNGNEILIQESSTNSDTNSSDQAYTCVTVTDVVPDYRGTLTADTPTRVIPLGIASTTSGSGLAGVTSVKFKWYSALNMGSGASAAVLFDHLDNAGKLAKANDATVPPTISLSLIIARNGATREGDFYQANNTNNLLYSTTVLLPSEGAAGDTVAATLAYGGTISGIQLINAGNVKDTTDHKNNHKPFAVTCKTDEEFACAVELNLSGTGIAIDNNTTAMLVASLPYGSTYSDFAVEMYRGSDLVDFTGVQLSVDSTGRTNQLFRRVEVRLDPADLFFPYPQYELDLGRDDDGSALKKYFWITANCWYSQPAEGISTAEVCAAGNNGPLNP